MCFKNNAFPRVHLLLTRFFFLTFKTICVLQSFKLSGIFHFSSQNNFLRAVLQNPQPLLSSHLSSLGLEDLCPRGTSSRLLWSTLGLSVRRPCLYAVFGCFLSCFVTDFYDLQNLKYLWSGSSLNVSVGSRPAGAHPQSQLLERWRPSSWPESRKLEVEREALSP